MPRYTPQEIKKWKEVFSSINTNGDRYITLQELIEAEKKDGMTVTDEQESEYIKDFDCHGNGRIEFSEFIKVLGGRTA